ncbi:MAG TPA: PAS domain-containing protein [Bryobacteraceae bacterium]
MYLVQIFRVSPLTAIALCVCLATILWCILLARRQQVGLDRLLTALLGMIAIYEALRLIKDSGIILFPGIHKLDGWVDFIIASLYLIAALILKASSSDRASTKVRLRLVEANEKTVESGKMSVPPATETTALFDASPLATFAQDSSGMVIYWNSAAERLFGWNRDEIVGQRLPHASAGPLRNKQGREIEAAVWNTPIRPPSGTVRGTLTIAADSSALRAAGLELANRVSA